jgi:hypothetical protein
MPTFQCSCGANLKLTENHLGKKIKCPKCSTIASVPATLPVQSTATNPHPGFKKTFASSQTTQSNDPFSGDFDFGENSATKPLGGDNSYQSAPSDRPAYVDKPNAPTGSSVAWGSVGVGALMVIGAVVWFIAGLAANIIFFYPPILLILGIVAIVKGFLGTSN